MQSVDTLVEARWVIPVEPEGVVPEHHTVVIDDGHIGAILPQAQARSATPQAGPSYSPDTWSCPDSSTSIPNTGMTLLRGFADDLPVMRTKNGPLPGFRLPE